MAQEFAKKFYASKQWEDCRTSYVKSVHGLCERCLAKEIYESGKIVHHKIYLTRDNIDNPEVTLNHGLLELLCQECHNKEHIRNRNLSVNSNLMFDEYGQLVEKKNVFIVWGSPASGKTTWVKTNMGKYDIVVDLDKIIQALCLTNTKTINKQALLIGLELVNKIYELIENHLVNYDNVYVIAMLPNKTKREALRRRLRAELIYMNVDKETCIKRALSDTERADKHLQKAIINKFFDDLEL